ncbi:unnamed protein product [Kuraishia capsulata CBS 1993]|uniref:Uncharacterized protein n=1 Tax=Kuraishia capsulata CBS 1993 TaxID=1382522 RepID=W6MHK1_9ASCO|nr:uncharacterized protein KUCA_T00001165001 [Kuraishia capsulata CBS 1993]CDK25198.1 unnamed protein product [Kuraishia capsulata CBS 1993]
MVMMVRDVTQFQDLIGEDVDLMLDSKNLDGLQVFSKGFQYMTQWLPFEQNSRLGLAISYGL